MRAPMGRTRMRKLPNDTAGDLLTDDATDNAADKADGPIRRCILSGERAERGALIRLAIGPEGQVAPDVRARAPGRGAWIGVTRPELEAAIAKGRLKAALARAFKTGPITVPDDLPAMIEEALTRALLDRLGLESRSGTLLTGSDRIAEAARRGKVWLLLHASDSSPDGNAKLDQAWRVGSDAEGSGQRGSVLPVDRTRLSVALGRDNAVHVALTDQRAAARIDQFLGRLLHFKGEGAVPGPGEPV
ncbi:MAG: transcription terminating nucleic-acid-binding protein [Blastomonas sp. CACIA14H2]|nr:MAG: transcription terminating nucleic-acid-binding protein [Blastomonas sp. CACIA14H2]